MPSILRTIQEAAYQPININGASYKSASQLSVPDVHIWNRNSGDRLRRSLLTVAMALGLTAGAGAQTLTGTVVDAAGQPVVGATLFLDNTTWGDITDERGHFAIVVRQAGSYLLVGRHVGFRTLQRRVLVQEGEVVTLEGLVMQEMVISLSEVIIEAMRPRKWRRYLRIFEGDVLGQSTLARRARLVNPEVLSFERIKGGFSADAAAPVVVENPTTGYRIHVFIERYEHHDRSGGHRLVRRLFFEEMNAPPDDARHEARERLYRGSMRHFLWAWYHDRVSEEGFYVYGKLNPPERRDVVASAVRTEPILVEYYVLPDRAYRHMLRQKGSRPPFSTKRQVSRITFPTGLMRVAANGYALSPVRQEGYWAFAGIGDAVPTIVDSPPEGIVASSD